MTLRGSTRIAVYLIAAAVFAQSSAIAFAQDGQKAQETHKAHKAQKTENTPATKELNASDVKGPPHSEAACLMVRRADSFSALTNRQVYVRTVTDEHFLLTMGVICIGLQNSFRIALANNVNRVCSNSTATITYDGLTGLKSCPVSKVERVDSRAAAQEIARTRMLAGETPASKKKDR